MNQNQKPNSGPRSNSGPRPFIKAPPTKTDPAFPRGAARAFTLATQIQGIDAQIAEVQSRGFEDATGLQLAPQDRETLKQWETKKAEVLQKMAKLT